MNDWLSELKQRKPKIGVLGITQELYVPIHPDIIERQERYARQVLEAAAEAAEFDFPAAAVNRTQIEERMRGFTDSGCDGVLIIMLTYGPSFFTYNALRRSGLPILLANVQPEEAVGIDWTMAELTYNQGIHGAQDMANALMWSGSRYSVWTGNWRSPEFAESIGRWAQAAKTVSALEQLSVAQIGQMPGMGDIQANPAELLSTFGMQIDQTGIGLIYREMEAVPASEVESQVKTDHDRFQVDPRLPADRHEYAVRFELALERFLESNGYAGFSVYFNAPADDGRFKQLPLLAASNLMAKGYGYGGEGDVMSTSLVTIGQLLAPEATFIEMYAMDFARESLLLSHMGEGNWKLARKDRPIRLVDRPLGIGGLENPPTAVFSAEPGPATLATLVCVPRGGFRLIVSVGEILDTEEMPNVQMPYYHYRPDTGVAASQNGWLRGGGSHHQCLNLGDVSGLWSTFCELTDVEFVRV